MEGTFALYLQGRGLIPASVSGVSGESPCHWYILDVPMVKPLICNLLIAAKERLLEIAVLTLQ